LKTEKEIRDTIARKTQKMPEDYYNMQETTRSFIEAMGWIHALKWVLSGGKEECQQK